MLVFSITFMRRKTSFLERRLLPSLFHEVVSKHGQTVGERLPRLELTLAKNSWRLPVAAHEKLRLLPCLRCKPLSSRRCIYAMT